MKTRLCFIFLVSAYLMSFFGNISLYGQDVEKLTDENFLEKIAEGAVIVDFYGKLCPPCQRFAPRFENVAQEMSDLLTFYKVDVHESRKVSQSNQIQSIPVVILYKEGHEVARHTGALVESTLKDFIRKHLER